MFSNSMNRRNAIKTVSSLFGSMAFAALATEQLKAGDFSNLGLQETDQPLAAKQPHFEPRAKRVIFLSMRGAPSHVDTFDYKPKLNRDAGRRATTGNGRLLASPWKFKQRGDNGLWMSDLFPNLASVADELCMLKGMHCDNPNHSEATVAVHTGNAQFVRPSFGAWSLYGLGTMNVDLPGFIVLGPAGGAQTYGSAFLPAYYQGTPLGSGNRALARLNRNQEFKVPNIANQKLPTKAQRLQLDYIQSLNKKKLKQDVRQQQVEGMIQSMELAFSMQSTMPELLDLSNETEKTRQLYGMDETNTEPFGKQCLTARRMIEAGVRFVEVTNGGWDHHVNLKDEMEDHCPQIDKPIAGLITDLKQRGLLKDTLVIWAGEFGRTPHGQGGNGRDHNNRGYTTFMAGGGVKGGYSYGATDDYGYEAVEGKMHTHDWHATILHLLGLDHERLTFRHAGRDFRLTDVHGKVAKDILA
ncbi:MAG: DUF1501 domain-containing protein [Planctomycetota bacterium]